MSNRCRAAKITVFAVSARHRPMDHDAEFMRSSRNYEVLAGRSSSPAGPARHALRPIKPLGDDRVRHPSVVPVILYDQSGAHLRTTGRERIIDEHDIAAIHRHLRGSRTLYSSI